MVTLTEQNYLKGIFHLENGRSLKVNTNDLAKHLDVSAASVTEMIKRLSSKTLINHEKYKGVGLTEEGRDIALQVIRRHRLWEFFLVEKLRFSWDQVHEIAEELEHINSNELVDRLDEFLGFPEFDPHGDPIPNKEGRFPNFEPINISIQNVGDRVKIVGVKDHSTAFYQYLSTLNLNIGDVVEINGFIDYDNSYLLKVNGVKITLTEKAIQQLRVVKEL